MQANHFKETPVELTATVSVTISREQFETAIIAVTDVGATRYWAHDVDWTETPTSVKRDCDCPDTNTFHWAHCELRHGGSMSLVESEFGVTHTFNLASLIDGWQNLASKETVTLARILNNEDDANTADVLIQCTLFGEVKYS